MREVTSETFRLDRLGPLIGPERYAEFAARVTRGRDALGGRAVWNVNSTERGGGVAEMLKGLVAYARGAGVDARWLVLDGDPEFFDITKRIHNGLHGSAGDGGGLGEAEHRHYQSVLDREADALRGSVRAGDVVVLHDPQTAGLVLPAVDAGAAVVWRCHVGSDVSGEQTERAWEFLRPYLEPAPSLVFSRPSYVPPYVPPERVVIIAPAIDPFSAKNEDMAPDVVAAVLTRIGYVAPVEGVGAAVFRRGLHGAVEEVTREALVVGEGPPPSLDTPVVVQVSRWDRLKDMRGVLEGFAAEVVGRVDRVQLALVGPSVAGVADDPEGQQVLAECTAAWEALPAAARRRVRLVSLPTVDTEENAAMVNAIQRHAAVVVQKSLVEGFGLTVSEAMWKGRPVVASAVGGILDQVTDGESGLLVRDPADLAEFGAALRRVLADDRLAADLGRGARERVTAEFLPERQLSQWVELITRQELLTR